MAHRLAAAALVILRITAAHADGPALRVLASSGTVVGDLPVARFLRPTATGGGRVVFRGLGTALHVTVDGVERTLLRSGDPLPAPLDGTVNEILDVATSPTGRMAVASDANSVQAAELILIGDAASPVPVVVHSAVTDPGIAGVAINSVDDLVFWTRTTIFTRLQAAGAQETIGTVGPQSRLRLRPVIDDASEVAWMTEGARGGIWYWSPGPGTIPIAQSKVAAAPFGGSLVFRRGGRLRPGFALDPMFGVAFTARSTGSADGAFLWSPSSGTGSVLARRKGRFGDGVIRRLRGRIQFADDGAVLIEADVRRTSVRPRNVKGWLRAKDGILTLADPPTAPPVVGPVHRLERRTAVFALDEGVFTTLVRPGDQVEGGETVASWKATPRGEVSSSPRSRW